MPTQPPTRCGVPGCPNVGNGHGQYSTFCEAHAKEKKAERDAWFAKRRSNPERNEIYGPAWKKFRAWLIACGNVICQFREANGARCTNPVVIFHHAYDPIKFPAYRYDARFVFGVCRQHHDDSPGEKYADPESLALKFFPTIIKTPNVG
jgi:hypothetical protein